MTFVLDGYNLLHAIGLLTGRAGPRGLEKARTALLGLVAAAHADDPGRVTVVFDARKAAGAADSESWHAGVRVVFTHAEEADDRIEWLIARDAVPQKLVVVSNDNRLRLAAKRRRCVSWTCERYLDWVERVEAEPRPAERPEKPAAGAPAEWLAAFGDLDADPAMRELFGPDFADDGSADDR